jgi:squalene-hopene/tetraprenyl-beta-curcumene cyclase
MDAATLPHSQAVDPAHLDDAVARADAALARRQNADGHWVFPLEADAFDALRRTV